MRPILKFCNANRNRKNNNYYSTKVYKIFLVITNYFGLSYIMTNPDKKNSCLLQDTILKKEHKIIKSAVNANFVDK